MIRAVIEMKQTGMSLRQIAGFLSEIGVPTKNRGKAWHPQMVTRILGRISEYNYQKEAKLLSLCALK